MQYIVQSEQEFNNISGSLQGGDVVAFAAGQYDTMNFKNLNFTSEVKFTSLDANNLAVFTDKTSISNSSNLTFENLSFELNTVTNTSSSAYSSLLYLSNSSNILISHNNIQGVVSTTGQDPNSVTDPNAEIIGYAIGSGISLNNVQDVTILNNDMHDLRFGVSLGNTQDTLISGNHIHDIRTDGIRGTDQINTVIESNLFENFHPWHGPNTIIGDHADMIQYWGTGASFGINGFVVKDNIFFQENDFTQTIFGRLNVTANQDPTKVALQNFEISGNLIYNGHTHGISLSGIDGVKVFDNTLIPNQYALANNTFPTIGLYGAVPTTIKDPVTGQTIVNPNFTLGVTGTDRPVVNAEIYNNITPGADWLNGVLPGYDNLKTAVDNYINQLAGINIHDNTVTSITATKANYFMNLLQSFNSSDGITLQDLLIAANSSAALSGHGSPYSYGQILDLSNVITSLPTPVPTVPSSPPPGPVVVTTPPPSAEAGGVTPPPVTTPGDSQPPVHTPEVPVVVEVPKAETPAEPVHTPEVPKTETHVAVLSDKATQGDDLIVSSKTNGDKLYGESGNDILVSGDGSDKLYGGRGDDILIAGKGNDWLVGGDGNDTFVVGLEDGFRFTVRDFELGKDTINIMHIIDSLHIDTTTKAIQDFVFLKDRGTGVDLLIKDNGGEMHNVGILSGQKGLHVQDLVMAHSISTDEVKVEALPHIL